MAAYSSRELPGDWEVSDTECESDSSNIDQEELEVALYSQVHFEPNNSCLYDYSQSDHLPQPDELLVEDVPITDILTDDKNYVKDTKKPERRKLDEQHDSGAPKIKKSKVVMTAESEDENYNSHLKDLSTFFSTLSDRTSLEGKSKISSFKGFSAKQQQQNSGKLLHDDTISIDSDLSDVIVIEEETTQKPHSSKNVKKSQKADISVVSISDSSDDDMLLPLGRKTSTSSSQDMTVHMVKITPDTDLSDILNSLPPCDWSLNTSDRLGTTSNGLLRSGSFKRYYGKLDVKCRNCQKKGHMSKDCSEPKKQVTCILCAGKGHIAKSCSQSLCHNCDRPGHNAQDCEKSRRSKHVECHRCELNGHVHYQCPEIWRQYHITTLHGTIKRGSQMPNKRKQCPNCARKGHFAHDCKKATFTKGLPCILTPFVTHYDSDLGRKRISIPENQKPTSRSSKIKSSVKTFINNVKGLVSSSQPSLKTKKGNTKKNKKTATRTKLDIKASGDFPRSASVTEIKKKNKSKKSKKGSKSKLYESVMNHMNGHYNGQNCYSPWEDKAKQKAAQKPAKKKKPKRGKKKDCGSEGERTLFVSNRGFKVTILNQK